MNALAARSICFALVVLSLSNPPLSAQPTSQPRSFDLLVIDPAGKPLPGAKVWILADGPDVETSTDGAGKLATAFRADVSYLRVHVEAPGFVAKEVFWNVRRNDQIPDAYTLKMEPGIRIHGRVTDDAGQPVEGANIVFWIRKTLDNPNERLAGSETVVSDAQGNWSFDRAPDGVESIDTGVWDHRYASDGFFAMDDVPLARLRDGSLTLTLERGQSISGVVVGPDGLPLENAKVQIGEGMASNRVPSQKTGPDGRFKFTAKPDTTMALTVLAKGHAVELVRTPVRADQPDVRIQLAAARPLRGRVVDAQGEPVPFAWIYPDTWRSARSLEVRLQADREGRFTWDEAPTDTIYCDIDATSSGFLREQRVAMSASDEERTYRVRRALRVVGTVVDAETNQPIEKFKVIRGISFGSNRPVHWDRRSNDPVQTGGKFDYLETYAREGYAARIEAEGYIPAESQVFPPDEKPMTLEFKLQRGKDVVATILKPDGTPAAGAVALLAMPGQSAYLQNAREIVQQGCQQATVADDGLLRFPAQNTTFTLVIFGDDGYAEVDSNALAGSDRITLQAWARVEGTLRVGDQPGASEQVSINPAERPFERDQPRVMHQIETKTDAQGRFVFDRVPPGQISVARNVIQPMAGGFMVSFANPRKILAEPGKTAQVDLGGSGQAVIGRAIIPPELAAKRDWSFDLGHLMTHVDLPPMPMPDEIKAAPAERQREWYTEFMKTDAGEAYTAKMSEANTARKLVPLQVKPDGTFRADDVEPGVYNVQIAIVQQQSDSTCPGGEPIAVGSAQVTIPEARSAAPIEVLPIELKMQRYIGVGQSIPDFDVKTLDGRPLKLSDLRGKYVLIDFWATWCGPCIEELSAVRAAYEALKGNPKLVMISFSLDNRLEDLTNYVQKNNMPWNQVFLEGGWEAKLVKEFGVRGIPSMWLIGPDGKVVARDLRGATIRDTVSRAIGN